MKVFINPGHAPNGNPDPGAVNPKTGLREYDVAVIIGNNLDACLRAVGYETKVLQSDSLEEICETANEWGADLFISIHCNSAGNDLAEGTEVWYQSDAGAKLAQCVDDQIINSLHTVDRGIKEAVPGRCGLYVLENTNMTAVLVETAFISNPDDEKLLGATNYQIEFARAIARGVTDYGSTGN